jgi:hypothetical protein
LRSTYSFPVTRWRAIGGLTSVDERASPEQEAALFGVFTGKQGGPVADLAALVGEVVKVERAPILFAVHEGKGTLRIGDTTEATMELYRGPGGKPTTLVDSIYSTIPGSPAYIAKASTFRMKNRPWGSMSICATTTRSKDYSLSRRSWGTPECRRLNIAAAFCR